MFNNNGVTNNEVTAGSAASAFNESPGSPPRTTTNRQPASAPEGRGDRGRGKGHLGDVSDEMSLLLSGVNLLLLSSCLFFMVLFIPSPFFLSSPDCCCRC